MPLPQRKLIPGFLLMLVIAAFAAPPLWWGTGDPPVIDPAADVNNHGPANIGQAKHMAKSALDALRPVLPAVADQIEADLAPIVDFTIPAPKTPEWIEKQKAPLLIGQLKAIADPFYSRLHAAAPLWLDRESEIESEKGQLQLNGTKHPGSIFPWTAETTDDANKAIANIGQLKAVFSLEFEADTDGEGLSDAFEAWIINYSPFDAISTLADVHPTGSGINGDFDGDGVDNLTEFLNGTDPTSIYSGGAVEWPKDAIVAWYRTDRDDITTDGTGAVSAWNNSVATGHVMTQPDTADQPELVVGALNGQDAVRFSAPSDHMSIASDGVDMVTPGDGGFSVLGIFRMGAPTGATDSSILSNESLLTSGFRMGVSDGLLSWWSDESGGTADLAYPTPVIEGETYQFSLNYEGSGAQDFSELHVNGALQASATGKAIVGNTNPFALQSIDSLPPQPGDWGELIITNRALERGEKTLVQDYLRAKHQGVGPLAGIDRSYEDLDFGTTPADGTGLYAGEDFDDDDGVIIVPGEDPPPVPDRVGRLKDYLTFEGTMFGFDYDYVNGSVQNNPDGPEFPDDRLDVEMDSARTHTWTKIEFETHSYEWDTVQGIPFLNGLAPGFPFTQEFHAPILYAYDEFWDDSKGIAVETSDATWGASGFPAGLNEWTVQSALFKTGYTGTGEEQVSIQEVVSPGAVGVGSSIKLKTVGTSGNGTERFSVTDNLDQNDHKFQYQLYMHPEFFGMKVEDFDAQEDQSEQLDPADPKTYLEIGESGRYAYVELPLGTPRPDLTAVPGGFYQLRWDLSWSTTSDKNFSIKIKDYSDPENENNDPWSPESDLGFASFAGDGDPKFAFPEKTGFASVEGLVIDISPVNEMLDNTEARLSVDVVMEIHGGPSGPMDIHLGSSFIDIIYVPDIDDDDPEIDHSVDVDEANGSEYRKISLVGRPLADGKPQTEEESDEEPEETFIDALTLDLQHSTTDVYVPVPASDLVLCVRRNASPEIWHSHKGLKPSEKPNLEFGPGWSSNLAAGLVLTEEVANDGQLVASMSVIDRKSASIRQNEHNIATVTDEHGRTYQFLIGYVDSLRTFTPKPSGKNQAEAYLTRLVENPGGTFTFTKKFGTSMTFSEAYVQKITHNRVYGFPSAANHTYCRVDQVSDRHEEKLIYTYPPGSINLIPSRIEVAGRPELRIAINQDEEGRVTAVRDPRGNEIEYDYLEADLSDARGPVVSGEVADAASGTAGLLRAVKRQGVTTVSYGYDAAKEDDQPASNGSISPWGHNLQTGIWEQYTTHTLHLNLSSIIDAYGNTTSFNYVFDHSRERYVERPVYSVVTAPDLEKTGSFSGNLIQTGLPRNVAKINLPGGREVLIGGNHKLRANPSGIPYSPELRRTDVTDAEGNEYFYEWDDMSVDTLENPDLGYVFPTSLGQTSKKPVIFGYKTMRVVYDGGGQETFEFTPAAGYALSKVTDFSGNVTRFEYLDEIGESPLKFVSDAFSKFGDPNTQIKEVDGVELVRRFTYDSAEARAAAGGDPADATRIMSSVTDELGRTTTYGISQTGLRTSEVTKDLSGNVLSSKSFEYDTTFPAFLAKATVADFGDFPGGTDPSWVTDLVTLNKPDSNGRIARAAIDMNGDGEIDGGDLVTRIVYDFNGNKLSIVDPSGNTTYIQYDFRNRVVSEVWPNETFKTVVFKDYEYDLRGNKVLETDERGIASAFVYDDSNRLIKTVRDMNQDLGYLGNAEFTGIDPNLDIVTSIEYNAVNSVVRAIDTLGFVRVTDYDYLQRLWRVITPKGDTPAGVVPDVATGYVTELFYDGENAGASAFKKTGFKPTRSVDPRGFETLVSYDELYRPVQTIRQYAAGKYSKSSVRYDNVGNVIRSTTWRSATDRDGLSLVSPELSQTSETEYDGLNRPETVTKAFGSSLESTLKISYTTTGFVHRTIDQTGADPISGVAITRATDHTYDAAGRLVESLGPEVPDETGDTQIRPLAKTFYNANGTVAATEDPLGRRWDFVYDSLNRRTGEVQPAVVDGETGLTIRPITRRAYDGAGNVIRSSDALGYVSTVQYDDANRAIKTTSPPVKVDGVVSNIVTAAEYDGNGNIISATDGRGNVTVNTYDALNRLATSKSNPTVVASSQEHVDDIVVINSYDPAGNLISVTDGAGQVTSFTYDGFNRKVKTIWDSNDPNRHREETTEYDASVIVRTTDAKGQVTEFSYDDRFRRKLAASVTRPMDNIEYTYDLADRLMSTSYPNETVANQTLRSGAWTYDALDRVLTETSNGVTHQTRYDAAGNTRLQIYGETERTLVCQYDSLNRLQECAETTGQTGVARVTSYAYDLGGGIVRKTLPNGTYETKEYDGLGRTSLIANHLINDSVTASYSYRHDAGGNVVQVDEAYPVGNLAARTVANTYDRIGRLLTETVTTATGVSLTAYQYDKANNRNEKSVTTDGGIPQVWSYTYGDAINGFNSNQLFGYNRPDSTWVGFTYDANGNRETRAIGAATDTYGYDRANRLISLDYQTDPDSSKNGSYLYGYDHRTRRVLRDESSANGSITRIVFSGGLSVQEYDGAATTPEVEYIRGSGYGGGVGGILYTLRLGAPSYNTYNSRGDVVGQTDDNSALTWQAAYEAFGTRTEEDGSTEDRQKANTKDEDPTGLLNEGFRYRDLEAGVFITRDPLGFVDGPNVYSYVRQNPWTMFDPLGLWEENAHFKKWSSRAADPNLGFFSRMAAIPMAVGEGLNPFRSDSNLRQGGREFQKNAAIAREQLKDAPPVIREIGQLTMGVAQAGAAPLTLPAGLGEMGDSYNQVGGVQTAKNMATGLVDHATSNPLEFIGEVAVPSVAGKGLLGKSARGVAESNSLAGFKPGQGFSGVFDPDSGSVLFRPSSYSSKLPDGWVPAKGGHVDVFKESGYGANAQGFTAFLKEGGDLSVQWKSGLNDGAGGVLPKPQRQPVLEALEKETGRKTYSDE